MRLLRNKLFHKMDETFNSVQTIKTKILNYEGNWGNGNHPSNMFNDGKRRIDMVVAGEEGGQGVAGQTRMAKRAIFEASLEEAGLQLERVAAADSFDKKTSFLKIHAPDEVLNMIAGVMGLKKPVKDFCLSAYKDASVSHPWQSSSERLFDNAITTLSSPFQSSLVTPEPQIFNPFLPGVMDKYVIKERSRNLTSAQRSLIVWHILARATYNHQKEKTGIQRLIHNGTYKCAFPLHDGDYDNMNQSLFSLDSLDSLDGGSDCVSDTSNSANDRSVLYNEWAQLSCWARNQPLWLIRRYFGPKIGLYFAWLGFYTQALILPAILGLLSFVYGLVTFGSPQNSVSDAMCDASMEGNVTMCPVCDKYCSYWQLKDSCLLAKLSYLLDNYATVAFAIIMSFWSTLFLEYWKRQQAILQWEWDLTKDDTVEEDDEVRPEFERVKNWRVNPITKKKEPYLNSKEKCWRFTVTISTIFLLLAAMIGALTSVIIFRVIVIAFMYQSTHEFWFAKYAKLIGVCCAGILNLTVCLIFEMIYPSVARYLTSLEHPRTELDFEKSYSFKMFLFQFINYYSSLIYTAFFKGRFYSHPGDREARESTLSLIKTDLCDPVGCMYEVTALLGLLMIIRQIGANFTELYYPVLCNSYRRHKWKKAQEKSLGVGLTTGVDLERWEKDFQLQEIDKLHLLDEYIELIIQYGFVTLFVAAFPLAPLLALINNILEIRLDAYKYTTQMRRPISQRVRDIGVWFPILEVMTRLAVIFNAFVVGLTSDFVPKMVYMIVYSTNNSLEGYATWSLSLYNTSDWGPSDSPDYLGPADVDQEVQSCRYSAYRHPPGAEQEQYTMNKIWLLVFSARLIFVLVFEHLVMFLTNVLSYFIPEVPAGLKIQQSRERHILRDKLFEVEKNKTLRRASHAQSGAGASRQENAAQEIRIERLTSGQAALAGQTSQLEVVPEERQDGTPT